GIDDVPLLVYLNQTLKETLRLHPPGPALLTRRALCDVTIGPWQLPKGALLRLTPWIVHRDPRWYPQPERFDPDRFAPDADPAPPRSAWLPFAAGPRV